MAELHDLTALEQADALAAAEVSALDLVEHYLSRIERHDPVMGAFVTLTGDTARREARAFDDATVHGATGRGRLAGVPTAIKDLNALAGVRTTFGSAVFADYVPSVSDEVVRRILAGGMISLGKTNTPEFGSPCYTENAIAPPAVTPWDPARMAGGSSGGAAAAVAAGLAPVAQGSDGGGSIRIPASCCGIVGLKPSRGRISGAPMYGEVTGLATAGPLGRTVRDVAAMLDVMAGPALGDPAWAPPPAAPFLQACDSDPGPLRVARFREPAIADAPVHPACVRAWERASGLLEELGHEVVEVPSPLAREAVAAFETCWAVLTGLSTVGLGEADRDRLQPLTRWLGERGERIGGPAFGLALGELRRAAAAVLAALAGFDLVLTPTLAQPPLPVGALRNDADPEADFEAQKRFTPWTSLWNVTGSPAISLPLHQDPEGLPIGVMLAAAPAREDLVLAVAAQLESADPWRDRVPGCW